MKTTLPRSRAVTARLISAVFLALGAPGLAACAAPADDVADPAELPAPGAVDVVQPLKLSERARVPEKEPGFVAAELGEREIVITHDGSLPPFAAGDVLGGTQGGGYLARVVRVRALDAARVALETTPADLTEFITEGHVHVHYDAREYAQAIDEHLARVRELGLEGDEPIASQAEALKIASGASMKLFELSSASLPASCGVTAHGTAALDVTAELSPVLDFEVHVGPRGGVNPVPELKQLRFVASGRLDVSATLQGSGTVTGSCTVDLLELAGGVPSVPLPTLTFWVGPVPIVVTTNVVPRATADVGLSFTAAEVEAEAQTTAEIEAGVDYKNGKWRTIWEPSCSASGTASIGAPGAITASGKVSAGAELRARLYGILGPNVGVQAYARVSAETAPPYCSYDARVDGGVRAYAEAEAGVSVGPLNLTFKRLDLVDLDLLRFDAPLASGKLRDAPECDAEP
ncbi:MULTISPECIES: hypothetical protein [Sorangium]|uniref:Secreted protein n=1 Tax=Sorangium cellulosum TaxID=56 RepID=A0A4P2QYE4_SORCE|nr:MULTISPECIES: hypothetical protein [Sorangium]AUX35569.1 hypothetical protein SOCE836_077640 [Sorangium cellulosum]WCQ94869.1 hypothetical protein NQZ70_07641 [Sorangium sp. Soce836]